MEQKRSTKGRGEGYYRELLSELEASGQSLRSFALERGLSPWTLYGWRARLGGARRRKRLSPAMSDATGFVAVDVVGVAERDIELVLSDGVRVRLPGDLAVERVIELVRSLRSC